MNYYSNGKLLLTGEYLVLDGAKSLAIPTRFGQNLQVSEITEPQLLWQSFTVDHQCWFEASFNLRKLRLTSATFNSENQGSGDAIAETLLDILTEAKRLNPSFLNTDKGIAVKTKLTFPRKWGLGSSSTLINAIANWAKVDAFQLLWNSFKGSGYDIACAQNDHPIFYQIKKDFSTIPKLTPIVATVAFKPNFTKNLFFVYLNQKQDSKEGIAKFRESTQDFSREIQRISELSEAFTTATNLQEFEHFLIEHEQIISSIIQLTPVKEQYFSDYFGAIKSLGAWGGDFVLATGDEKTPDYFKSKGYQTVIPYDEMVL